MKTRLAMGLAQMRRGIVKTIIDFTTGSSGSVVFTNAKTGTNSTRRDANWKWQTVPTTTVRYHRCETSNEVGILFEPAITNFLTCQKYNVTATTNITKGGDAASTLTVANDATTAALIADSELSSLVTNGNLFLLDNTAGVADAYVDFAGSTGATSKASLSVFAAGGASGSNGRLVLYNNVGAAENATNSAVSGTSLVRIRQNGVTPANTTDTMRIYASAGKKIYFIVPQLETFWRCTTPIISTSTGSQTRNRDDISSSSINFGSTNGGFAARIFTDGWGGNTEGLISITDTAGGSANCVGMGMISSRPMAEATVNTNSTDDSTNDIHGFIPSRSNWVGAYWNSSQCTVVGYNLRFNRVTREAFTSPLNRIWIGKRRQFADHGCGMIFELTLFTGAAPNLTTLALEMIPANAIAIGAFGQSNMRVYGRDETSGSNKNDGEIAIVSQLSSLYPSNTCYWLDGSISGTNLDDDPSGPSWMKINGGNFLDGEHLTYALEILSAFVNAGGQVIGMVWNQGENDQGGPTVQEWKDRLKYILDRLRTVASVKVGLIEPANRTVVAAGYNVWRNVFRLLADENPSYIYRMPMTYWLSMDATNNNLHISPSGTVQYAPILARKVASVAGASVSGAVDGPRITAASRVGVTITVTIAYDGGTDFTPAAAIQGFRFYDNGSEIAISSAVRTNATTITLTLASAGTGVSDVLFYGAGTMSEVTDWTKVVRDTSTYQLGLFTEELTLPYSA